MLVPGTGRNFDVQRQRIEIEGLEVNLRTETPIRGLKLGIGYAHIQGRYDPNADDVVDTDLNGVNISPDRVNLSAIFHQGPVSAILQTQYYLARSFHADAGRPQPDQRNNFGG